MFDHQCQADQCAQDNADDFPCAVRLKARTHGENRQNCHGQPDEDAEDGGGVSTGEEHCHQTGHDVCRPEQQQRKLLPFLLPALQKEIPTHVTAARSSIPQDLMPIQSPRLPTSLPMLYVEIRTVALLPRSSTAIKTAL